MSGLVNTSGHHQRMPVTSGASGRIQVLGEAPAIPQETRVLARDGSLLHLHGTCRLRQGAAVRIDVNGGMVLGEVHASEPSGSGFVTSVSIQNVIPSVSDLARLVERVMCEARPPRLARKVNAAGA